MCHGNSEIFLYLNEGSVSKQNIDVELYKNIHKIVYIVDEFLNHVRENC